MRRSTRHSHNLEGIGIHTRRRSKNEDIRIKQDIEGRGDDLDSVAKQNRLLRHTNGKYKKANCDKQEENGENGTVKPNSTEDNKQKQHDNIKDDKQEASSENEIGEIQTSRKTRSHKVLGDDNNLYYLLSSFNVCFVFFCRKFEFVRSWW